MTKSECQTDTVKDLTSLRRRQRPLGGALRQAHRAVVLHLEKAISQAGYNDIGASQLSILESVDPEGTRLVELATRGGRTKQATAELCAGLVARGYLEVRPDPTDSRAKLFVMTPAGRRLVEACFGIVSDYENWLIGVLGSDSVDQLRETLSAIIDRPAEE